MKRHYVKAIGALLLVASMVALGTSSLGQLQTPPGRLQQQLVVGFAAYPPR